MKKFKTTFMVALMLMTTFASVQPLYAETRTHEDCNLIAKERSEILDIEQEAEKDKQERYLGEFNVSFYCGCAKCNYPYGTNHPCADGTMPKSWHTISVDPNVIPLGTKVEIEGFDCVFQAHDKGGAIKKFKIDIFLNDHDLCLQYGRLHNVKVYKVKDGDKFEI